MMKSCIELESDNKSIETYFDSLSNQINITNYTENQIYDFKVFRECPLIRIDKNAYLVINQNFFIDKLYNSIIYKFYNYIMDNKNYKANFQQFKGDISLKFTEKILFHSLIDYITTDNSAIKVNGEQYSYEYSDYYIRIGYDIFLFEFKDYNMDAKNKNSFNYDFLCNYIKDNYVEIHGYCQLYKVIKSIEKNTIQFDNIKLGDNDIKKYSVYPVIVFTDSSLDNEGINYLVSRQIRQWRKDKNSKLKVKDLIMVNLDTLLLYKEVFSSKTANIFDLLKSFLIYINSKSLSRNELQELCSFSEFCEKYMKKNNITNIFSDKYFGSIME